MLPRQVKLDRGRFENKTNGGSLMKESKNTTVTEQHYESPNFEVIAYETQDIITASGVYGDNDFSDPWGKL